MCVSYFRENSIKFQWCFIIREFFHDTHKHFWKFFLIYYCYTLHTSLHILTPYQNRFLGTSFLSYIQIFFVWNFRYFFLTFSIVCCVLVHNMTTLVVLMKRKSSYSEEWCWYIVMRLLQYANAPFNYKVLYFILLFGLKVFFCFTLQFIYISSLSMSSDFLKVIAYSKFILLYKVMCHYVVHA